MISPECGSMVARSWYGSGRGGWGQDEGSCVGRTPEAGWTLDSSEHHIHVDADKNIHSSYCYCCASVATCMLYCKLFRIKADGVPPALF